MNVRGLFHRHRWYPIDPEGETCYCADCGATNPNPLSWWERLLNWLGL